MRIVLDLQAAQSGAAPDVLPLALALLAHGSAHALHVLLCEHDQASVDRLRHALGALAPERISLLTLPPADSGLAPAIAPLLRRQMLADLAPDVVLCPRALCDAALVLGSGPFASVLTVNEGDLDGASAAQWRALGQATLVLADNDGSAARVRAQAGCAATVALGATDILAACASLVSPEAAPPARPRLAYVSPLPPARSGIADYSAELVPELARYYRVELIIDQASVSDARVSEAYPLRPLDWFAQHAHEFDRIVYHIGNSPMHSHMFGLIARHPGIVVLHDFYIGNIIDHLDREHYLPQGYLQALYDSHGFSALFDHARNGRHAAVWKYPVNRLVLDHASGVIVHSTYARQLAAQWYGAGAGDNWQCVPLLRGKPPATAHLTRAEARAQLGLREDQFVVCSFGMLGRTKLNEEVLAGFAASRLAADSHCQLVFVGSNDAGAYGRDLTRKLGAGQFQAGITGFVDAERYACWLQACDVAVQLRGQSRGETSAAILDCLLYGVPTIINAHGAGAELPDEVLIKLPDSFTTAELAAALERLHGDPAERAALARRAADFIGARHAPEHAGAAFASALEAITRHSPQRHYQQLLASLAALPAPPGDAALQALARAIAANRRPPVAPRQLLVDVSALVQTDLRTGIQRVVRSILLALLEAPPAGMRIEPVYSPGANQCYRYARRFTLDLVGQEGMAMEDAPLELHPGDIFLGLDLMISGTNQNQAQFQAMRARGLQIVFVVYDLLPVLRPAMFPFGTEHHFSAFLHTIATVADGLLCISRAVADELIDWLAGQPLRRPAPLQIGFFHLGADIDASAPTQGLPSNAAQVLAQVRARPTLLMVGTVEPRKGHAQALAALDLLWQQDVDVNLVVVGKQGWMMEAVAERMRSHPQAERRLFWLAGVSDQMLLELYASATVLLAASEGEGFGLPLIEAAQHGIAIIARDLPVFREVAGEHAHYFSGLEAGDIAIAVDDWLALHRTGQAPQSRAMGWLNWQQSAGQLLDAVVGQHWYRSITLDKEA